MTTPPVYLLEFFTANEDPLHFIFNYFSAYKESDKGLLWLVCLIPRTIVLVPYFEGLRIWQLFCIGLVFGICFAKTCLSILASSLNEHNFAKILVRYQQIFIVFSASAELVTLASTIFNCSLFWDTVIQILTGFKAQHMGMPSGVRFSAYCAAFIEPLVYISFLDQLRSIPEDSHSFLKRCSKMSVYTLRKRNGKNIKLKWKVMSLKVASLRRVGVKFLSEILVDRSFYIMVCFNLLLRIVDALLLFDQLVKNSPNEF